MFVQPNRDAFAALLKSGHTRPIVMLNLLRFRDEADYSADMELAPKAPISGLEAYKIYSAHALPLLQAAGSEVVWKGKTLPTLIGPSDAQWHLMLLVRHVSVANFIQFASDPIYLAKVGHRTAALADSRLIPISG